MINKKTIIIVSFLFVISTNVCFASNQFASLTEYEMATVNCAGCHMEHFGNGNHPIGEFVANTDYLSMDDKVIENKLTCTSCHYQISNIDVHNQYYKTKQKYVKISNTPSIRGCGNCHNL